jgi:hypothetical protein
MAITMRNRERREFVSNEKFHAPVCQAISSCYVQPQNWLNQFSGLLHCSVVELKWLFPREKATCMLSVMARKAGNLP